MRRLLLGAALAAGLIGPVAAAELAGVVMPATLQADGQTLALNGLALRTYSIFKIHIYVGGLYLEHPTHDPAVVMADNQPRVIAMHFLHDVPVEKSRSVWRQSIEKACEQNCMPASSSIDLFLSHLREIKSGDRVDFIFTGNGLDTAVNGVPTGRVDDPAMAHAILEVFIGPHAPTPNVKLGLMGG
jgi:hypothetical protein